MSVLLEGRIEKQDNLLWTGRWQFMKEKKISLNFHYKKISNNVDKSLVSYVSFINTLSMGKKYKSKEPKSDTKLHKNSIPQNRGRGRPPSITSITMASADLNQSYLQTLNQINEIKETSKETEVEETLGETFATKRIEAQSIEVQPLQTESIVANEMKEEAFDAGNDLIEIKSEDIKVANLISETTHTDGIQIPPIHPMLGLWEGTFDVKSAKPGDTSEVPCHETFFFYHCLGENQLIIPELQILPPEPSYPFSLLLQFDPPTNIQSVNEKYYQNILHFLSTQNADENSTSCSVPISNDTTQAQLVDASTASDSVGLTYDEPQTSNAENKIWVAPSENPCLPIKTEIKSESLVVSHSVQSIDSIVSENEKMNDELNSTIPRNFSLSSIPSANNKSLTDLLEAIGCKVLFGFGKNSFGRFSIAGIYDEKSGELRCEKKYLVTKFSAKRGRRSFAETMLSTASSVVAVANLLKNGFVGYGVVGNEPSEDIPVPVPTPLNRRSSYSSDNKFNPMDSETGKRKRLSFPSSSAKDIYFHYSDKKIDNEIERKIGLKNLSYGGDTTSWNRTNYTNLKLNATIGGYMNSLTNLEAMNFRNADTLDDLQTSPYREAFLDCETGEIYEGGWQYGARHGKGVCLYNDGLLYDGSWTLGKENGYGQLMTGDRQVIYEGEWLEGHIYGFGTYHFGNGDRYTGDWREGNRQGKGEYYFVNGCKYVGDWKDNKRCGKGIFYWSDNSYYDGDWDQDQRHGRGVLELKCGLRYEGQWSNNLMEGKGTCTFPSGQIYQGTYKRGMREGRGSIHFAEGAIYEGRFKDDHLDGQGTIKVERSVPGADENETLVPIQLQSELWRIHLRAGFGNDSH